MNIGMRSCLLHRQLRSRLLQELPRLPPWSNTQRSTPLVPATTSIVIVGERNFATEQGKARPRRRKRPKFGVPEGKGPPRAVPETAGLAEPFAYGGEDGEDTNEYLKKTSLSPWVPTPDPIARKLFDMSAPTPEDIHVELGCGDGRVNFHAIDHGKVKKSTGIDIDDGIMKRARERLMKRYPQPPIEFITADILDYNNEEVWEKIQEATIITMYFVQDALEQLRPILEEKLVGRQCKIITCSYPMPGWNHFMMETTLGTTCYLYNWGSTEEDDGGMSIFAEDSLLVNKPKELLDDPFERMRAEGLDVENIERIPRKFPDRASWDDQHSWTDDEDEEDDDDDDSDSEETKSKDD